MCFAASANDDPDYEPDSVSSDDDSDFVPDSLSSDDDSDFDCIPSLKKFLMDTDSGIQF